MLTASCAATPGFSILAMPLTHAHMNAYQTNRQTNKACINILWMLTPPLLPWPYVALGMPL